MPWASAAPKYKCSKNGPRSFSTHSQTLKTSIMNLRDSHLRNQHPSHNLKMSTAPKPLFVYGTLRALPLLAWALTGQATQVHAIKGMLRKATVSGYKRCALHGCDYPAAIKDENSSVDGYVLLLETTSQRRMLDDFEGEVYKVTPVTASIIGDSEDDKEEIIEVDMYVWDGDMSKVSLEPWDLELFIADRLDDWLDLFDGMELVGSSEY